MQALDKDLRNTLEKTVKEARDVAETGARAALNRIGVGDKKKPDFLDDEQAELRRRLRARGRQLGDTLRSSGAQDVEHLVREVAYEHWHRMLFGRYLAANNLLMHPEFGMPVTLDDCEELAGEEGARDGFALAARYATDMLPQIFRADDPVLEVEMAPEYRNKLQRMVEGLPQPVFEADDSLGWVYQFWQAKRKDEVNASGVKIGADELPAVTQLFTEHYMVQFLLDNTLGAWWTARHPDTDLSFEYLRTLDDGTPAAGTFDGWPDTAAELTVMDPCMGSGHFLVAALPMLTRMRMQEEGCSARDAVDAVLRDNLHGLEIDERCTQIAAFALALAAWTFPGAEGVRELPEMNLACSGLAPKGSLEDWETLAGDDERLQNGMRRLYSIFRDAPTLGSLIDPSAPENRLDTATFEELEPLLKEALAEEQDAETTEREVVAYGIARAAEMLSARYHLVVTNVPFLNRGKQNSTIRSYCDDKHGQFKGDLATCFADRVSQLSQSASLVLPQNWFFLLSYEDCRRSLLKRSNWHIAVQLGEGAFESSQAAGAFTSMLVLTHKGPLKDSQFYGIDLTDTRKADLKKEGIKTFDLNRISQQRTLLNPDSRINVTGHLESENLLGDFADSFLGLGTGDYARFGRCWWEINPLQRDWEFQQTPVTEVIEYGGRTNAVYWDSEEGRVRGMSPEHREKIHNQDQSGQQAWGKRGVAVSLMRDLDSTLYNGALYNKSTACLIPNQDDVIQPLWCYAKSNEFHHEVRKLDQNMVVANGTLEKIPFDLDHWQQVAEEKYPDGLPEPYSDDPTQWIFHGHPAPSTRPLQVAVARLLGYRWPAERDDDMELSDEARAWVARAQELNQFSDDDGIVCLPAVQGERPAIDRLRDLLAAAYGDAWSAAKEEELLANWGYKRGGLERWLEGKFMRQHNKLFGHRPFIWHITDGHSDGFGALVNYHKLDRPTLERLTYTYLGDWIKRQEGALARDEDGAEGRLLAAQKLQDELKNIIEGEPPYDIFVRWKEAHEQPIGWDPDLNDGVLLNIKPFTKGDGRPGILKKDPNVRYTKDRGKNPDGAPWGPLRYNRYEDVPGEHKLKAEDGTVIEHLTNEVKRKAREQHRQEPEAA